MSAEEERMELGRHSEVTLRLHVLRDERSADSQRKQASFLAACRGARALYNLSIRSVDTVFVMAKAFKAFRFPPELYAKFKKLATSSGLMVTEAFEKFMEACVNAAAITFPTADRRGVEAEARVLLAWLRKGKWFYYSPAGEEDQSVESRLLALVSQVQDENLSREIEEDLKKLSEPT